jgi:hypothetical protein
MVFSGDSSQSQKALDQKEIEVEIHTSIES